MNFTAKLIQFAIGCCGAMIAEIQHWHRIARRGKWPTYSKSVGYWIVTSLVVLSGGIVAALVSNIGTSSVQLLMLGMVGPQLLYSTAQSKLIERQDQTQKKTTNHEEDEPHLGGSPSTLVDFLGT